MTDAQIERRLRDAGANRREVEEERSLRARLLRNAVHTAHAAGWTKVRIAEAAGITRQTVHTMLKEET